MKNSAGKSFWLKLAYLLFLPGCLRVRRRHERHSNCPAQEVHDQWTTSMSQEETNDH